MGAVKEHKGRPRLDLLPWEPLEEVAHVMEAGARKEGRREWDWKRGTKWSLYLRPALTHIASWALRRGPDSESKRSHLAHAIACLLILLDYEIHGVGDDDRYNGEGYAERVDATV